jgi:hypothetical protein
LFSLVLSTLLADNLAERLSRPIKAIAEALRRNSSLNKKLKLADPTSLELLILSTELNRIWNRVMESEQINVREIVGQNQRLETFLESVEDCVLVVDADGKVSHCNRNTLSLISLTLEQVREHPWRDLPTMNENYLTLRAVLGDEMSHSQEIELDVQGKRHQFSARSKAIVGSGRDDAGKPGSTLFLLHDITEKRQREKFRTEFVDLLSHELKTPLQSLGTASESLLEQRAQLPEGTRLLIETIAEDIERIRAVANEFIQVTQSQSKILKLKMNLTALNQSLQEWIKPFQIVAKDRKVKLHYVQEGSPVIWANIDPVKFPWVVSNLLSNAIRFSPVGGDVTVLLTDRNGSVEISVLDDGPGVSVEDQRRMFEPFFQSAMATTTGHKGLFGIGLTIAKEVVEAHDGRVEYHPRKPQGSDFRIILPFPPLNYT